MGASRSLLLLGLLTMLCKNYIAETGTMEVCFGPAASYKCRLSTMTPYRYIGNLEDSKIEYNGKSVNSATLRRCEPLWSAREIASMALSAEQARHAENVFHIALTFKIQFPCYYNY